MTRPIAWVSDSALRIDRAHYVALRAPDSDAASRFAVAHMGFTLVHVDREGRHYLAAHGLDRYSLVYVPGKEGIDHLSFLVRSPSDLKRAAAALAAAGVASERIDEPTMWRHEPALRFSHPNGVALELTTGANVDSLMHWAVVAPRAAPAPITCDHAILRASDVAAANTFASDVMGLLRNGSIEPKRFAPCGVYAQERLRAICRPSSDARFRQG
jgi:catechol 2,3-dioxygenase